MGNFLYRTGSRIIIATVKEIERDMLQSKKFLKRRDAVLKR